MICQNTVGQNSVWDADTIRGQEALIMPNGKKRGILPHGSTTKAGTNTIMNSLEGPNLLAGMKMPVRYVVEMFLDRIAASKVYLGDAYTSDAPLAYYENGRADELMHKDTRELLEKLLHMLAEEGEETTYRSIKKIRRGSVGSSEAIYCASWRDGLEQEKTGTGTKGYSLK